MKKIDLILNLFVIIVLIIFAYLFYIEATTPNYIYVGNPRCSTQIVFEFNGSHFITTQVITGDECEKKSTLLVQKIHIDEIEK